MPSVNPYQVTRFVTFRRSATQGSPCSSVWQNGDAGLTMLAELIADCAGATFVADGRLKSVDAARGGIGWHHVLVEPLELRGVLGAQGAPLGGSASFAAEGAELDAEAAVGSRSRRLAWRLRMSRGSPGWGARGEASRRTRASSRGRARGRRARPSGTGWRRGVTRLGQAVAAGA